MIFDHVYTEPHPVIDEQKAAGSPTTRRPSTPTARRRVGGRRNCSRRPSRELRASDRRLPLAKALNAGLRKALQDDAKVLLMGEDIGPLGGVFRVTEGLQRRVRRRGGSSTPRWPRPGIVGTAIGLAMRGLPPGVRDPVRRVHLPRLRPDHHPAGQDDQPARGPLSMPVVIRVPYGGHIGAVEHHQESPEAYFAHTPGLRLVSPSTPNDAYWMIQEAIASQRPGDVLRAEEPLLAEGPGRLLRGRALPLHASRVVRTGHRRHPRRPRRHGERAAAGRRRSPQPRAPASRSSTCARSRRSTTRRSSPRCARPGGSSSRQEAPGFVSVASEIAATVAEKAFYSLRGAGAAGVGFDAPVPAGEAGGHLPARRRPGPRGRRPGAGLLTRP